MATYVAGGLPAGIGTALKIPHRSQPVWLAPQLSTSGGVVTRTKPMIVRSTP